MASLFGRIDLATAGPMNAVHSSKWEHRPMAAAADVNAPAGPDASRPVRVVAAIYKEPTAVPFIPNGFDPRSTQRPGVASGHPEVEIDPRVNAGVDVKCPDLLIEDEGRGKVWRVMKARNDEMGRIFAVVNLVVGPHD
jgi:hypothetical protein